MVGSLLVDGQGEPPSPRCSPVATQKQSEFQGSDSTITYLNEDSERDLLDSIDEDSVACTNSEMKTKTQGSLIRNETLEEEKQVRFSKIDFRCFYSILGDNPVSSLGYSFGLCMSSLFPCSSWILGLLLRDVLVDRQ